MNRRLFLLVSFSEASLLPAAWFWTGLCLAPECCFIAIEKNMFLVILFQGALRVINRDQATPTTTMWIQTSRSSKAWVTWVPPNARLHYAELYQGLWEFLRMPPRRESEARAREYLKVLLKYPEYSHLQPDRIRWVRSWLEALPAEEERRKAIGETRYALLTWVCYQPPVVGRGVRMRAG